LSDLHPLNLWFGGISWVDIGAYTGRLILMRGIQAALRAGVWGFLVGSTMRIGRKFCGWGTLLKEQLLCIAFGALFFIAF
jgi:hypothetical protein